MTIRLKNAGCKEVSFVEEPMNGFPLAYRDGVAHGVVQVPDIPSRHAEFGGQAIVLNLQEIRRARDDWQKRGRVMGIDHTHALHESHVEVTEDVLTSQRDGDIPAGSWLLTIRAKHPRLRNWLGSGVLTGFSPLLTGDPDDLERDSFVAAADELLERPTATTEKLLQVCDEITGRRHGRPTRLAKVQDEKDHTFALAAVLVPEEIDRQGDVIDADEVEEAAHSFMERGQRVGSMHRKMFGSRQARVVESYVLRHPARFGETELPAGTWMMGIRAYDPALRKQILEGTFTGFSIGGVAEQAA